MALITGIGGAVAESISSTVLSGIGKWTIDPKVDMNKYASSATAQAQDSVTGNADWSGEYEGYGDAPLVWPGDAFGFIGSIDGTNGCTGSAIVDEFSLKLDVEGGKEIMHSIKFSGNDSSGLVFGSAAAVDSSARVVTTAVGLVCKSSAIASSPSWSAINDIRTMDLTIKSDNKEYVSSSTGGNKKRTKGNFMVTANFSLYVNTSLATLATAFPLGSQLGIQFYTGASSYYQMLWLNIAGYSGIEVDRNTANIVGATINCELKTTVAISGTPTIGSVKYVNGSTTTLWSSSSRT